MSNELSKDEGVAWEVFLQGLDVTSGELVNEVRKDCENPLTLTSTKEIGSFFKQVQEVLRPLLRLLQRCKGIK